MLFFKNFFFKKLSLGKKKFGGRNFFGSITVRHLGGGHRRRYRLVDFRRILKDIPAKVRRLEYDPNRGSYLILVCYDNSYLSYMLSPNFVRVGDIIVSSLNYVFFKEGNSGLLKFVPVGSFIYNIEFFPNFGGQLSRAAGSFCQVLRKFDSNYVLLKLRSNEFRLFFKNNFCSFGTVYNKFRKFEKNFKAGQSRYMGIRPIVRGEAMNPVDHPHGGNTSGGRHPVSPWGKLAKGSRTKVKRNYSFRLIKKLRFKKV